MTNKNQPFTKDLLEFEALDVSNGISDTNNVNEIVEKLLKDASFESVEVLGEADNVFLMKLFLALQRKISNIAYRKSPDDAQSLVWFTSDTDVYDFPVGMVRAPEFSDFECLEMDKSAVVDMQDEVEVNLEDIELENSKEFLWSVYSINPKKKKVKLNGYCDPAVLFQIVDWFATGHAENILINNVSVL